MKYLKEYQEYNRVEDTNEFFNFKSKEDSKFIDELINRIKKKEYVSIGSTPNRYNVIFKDKIVSVSKETKFGVTGFIKTIYNVTINQNKEKRELNASQSINKKIYNEVETIFNKKD